MQAHTRAMIAAAAYAAVTGKTVTGLYDEAAGEQLRIAAECRGDQLQGADGERSARFSGTLPELFDYGDQTFVSLEVAGGGGRGYDRGSQGHYVVEVDDRVIQLYDYAEARWFAFQVLKFDS